MSTIAATKFEKRSTDLGWYWTSKSAKAPLRQSVRNLDRTKIKQASIGGEQEAGFEQAFSSLAYAYLKDKSPRLIDYIIGFQLVDRNEDNTKAMGVFGFKVGDQWLYAPVFFLNGDLKGHELLYVKKQDAFVPMKENWVNYLISRKPHVLGEGSPKDTYQLGGVPPDIYRLSHPPTSSKYGSDSYRPRIQEWALPFLTFAGAAATKSDKIFQKHAGLDERLNLKRFLGENIKLAEGAFELTQRHPLLKAGFEKFYGKDFFLKLGQDMLADAKSLIKKVEPQTKVAADRRVGGSLVPDAAPAVHPLRSGDLQIIVYDALAGMNKRAAENKVDMDSPSGFTQNKDELDSDEREKLLKDTVLVKDKRDSQGVSQVYDTQVRMELINPGETGVYDVLEKPGSFDEMLVIMHPHTNRGREQWATVIRLSDPRNWMNIHASNLWVKPNAKPDRPDFQKWWKGLSDSDTLEQEAHYLAIGENGAGTTPFRIRKKVDDDTYRVDFKDHCDYGKDRPTWLPSTHSKSMWVSGEEYVSTYDALLHINPRDGAGLKSVGGELNIPKNFKVFKLKDPPKPKKRDEDGLLMGCSPCMSSEFDSGSETKPINPGNISDVQLMLFEKTASIRVLDRGCDVYIKANGHEHRMTKKAAFISLIRDHGTNEVSARNMLRQAEKKGSATYRIKYAEGFGGPTQSALAGGPGAPAFPPAEQGMERVGNGQVSAIYPQEEFHQAPELMSGKTDPTIYDPFYQPDQQAMQTAQEAGAAGQKEVFDTAMISGMLKAVRQDSLVDRYLGDLMKALDKLGRILFMFYWHQEEFEDRYGKQDLPELEDSLRNAFEVMGDVCLFLKEKQVGGGMDGQFGNMANPSDPSVQEAARN